MKARQVPVPKPSPSDQAQSPELARTFHILAHQINVPRIEPAVPILDRFLIWSKGCSKEQSPRAIPSFARALVL